MRIIMPVCGCEARWPVGEGAQKQVSALKEFWCMSDVARSIKEKGGLFLRTWEKYLSIEKKNEFCTPSHTIHKN